MEWEGMNTAWDVRHPSRLQCFVGCVYCRLLSVRISQVNRLRGLITWGF